MSDRLNLIREAVKRDVANIEDAYADRAWLLSQYDALLTENKRLVRSGLMHSPHVNGQAAEQLSQSWRERLGIYP